MTKASANLPPTVRWPLLARAVLILGILLFVVPPIVFMDHRQEGALAITFVLAGLQLITCLALAAYIAARHQHRFNERWNAERKDG